MRGLSIYQLSLGIVMILMWTYFDGSLFSFHVLGMSIAFFFLMPAGIIEAGTKTKPYDDRIACHYSVMLLVVPCVAGGFYAIYKNKNIMEKPHFQTWHSWMGLAAVAAAAFSLLTGTMALYRSSLPAILRYKAARQHRGLGVCCVGAGAAAACVGLQPLYPEHPAHRGLLSYALVCALATLVVLIYIYSGRSRASPQTPSTYQHL
eukprot:Rmarinus@m.11796